MLCLFCKTGINQKITRISVKHLLCSYKEVITQTKGDYTFMYFPFLLCADKPWLEITAGKKGLCRIVKYRINFTSALTFCEKQNQMVLDIHFQ